jgi:hypothetical protein
VAPDPRVQKLEMLMATEKPKVLVRFDRVYGKIACYPANGNAQCITALTKKKTLDSRDIELARDLGFEIQIAPGSAAVLNEFFNKEVIARVTPEMAEFMDSNGALRKAGLMVVES